MTREILHSFIAIAAGFLATAILVGLATLLVRKLAPPAWSRLAAPQPGGPDAAAPAPAANRSAMFVNLIASALFAAVGGAITAFLAPSRELLHALVLAIVLLAISAVAVLEGRGRYPAWYQAALMAFTAMAALGGGIFEVLFR